MAACIGGFPLVAHLREKVKGRFVRVVATESMGLDKMIEILSFILTDVLFFCDVIPNSGIRFPA